MIKTATNEEIKALDDARHELQSKAFDLVKDPTDWKKPIEAWIPAQYFRIVSEAVTYFTATTLESYEARDGEVHVKAIGYRAGPAGDH